MITKSHDDGNATEFTITPKVDEVQEFIEIANDFTNPLELVREAISNAYDAKATTIQILFDVPIIEGENVLRIHIVDDGEGMGEAGLQAFFDLGNSLRRQERPADNSIIGEKGHGTKVYFKSQTIRVTTCRGGDGDEFEAILKRPLSALYEGAKPQVQGTRRQADSDWHGTEIEILGYNNNRREMFSHKRLKDYILWFTRFGSLQDELTEEGDTTRLLLQGLDRKEPEELSAGHPFPPESLSSEDLFDTYMVKAPRHYARRWQRTGALPHFPDIEYQASFWVEGDTVKRQYNPMLRVQGRTRRPGEYQVQERYGLWLCKDFIPIERKEEWVTTRGSEYTKFHAFFNCQAFNLTANRGSVANTPSEILADVEEVCRKFYRDIVASPEWVDLEYLEEQASSYTSLEKERTSLESRSRRIQSVRRIELNECTILEPTQEAGVYSAFLILSTLRPDILPFEVLDYDTHLGIDVVARLRSDLPITETRLYYVEFKYALTQHFNHSFEHLHGVVCWKLDCAVGDEIIDATGYARVLEKVPPEGNEPTQFFLSDERSARRIEVIVLPTYVQDNLGLTFS